MKHNPFHPTRDVLPDSLPLFPLSGALLLPEGRLPLNIFEPRYLAMVQQALATNRMIGMIQRRSADTLYSVGCAGRIVSFEETDDGRFLIVLYGVCRFTLGDRLPQATPFLQYAVDFSSYLSDLAPVVEPALDKEALLVLIKRYLHQEGFISDGDTLARTALSRLVISISMICPFSVEEKQALLEAQDINALAGHLQTLLTMRTLAVTDSSTMVN